MLAPWQESYDQPRQHIQKQRHYFANKGPSSQGYGFSNGHVWMWELDYKESWAPKNWCFWTVVLEKTLESPLDCKKIQPVHPKGDQSWLFIGRTNVKLKLQYFGHLMRRADSFEKILMLGKIEVGEKGDNRGWDGWMASLTQWTWVWVDSGSWWWTGRPGVLQSTGSHRVGHDWVTELNWNSENHCSTQTLPGCCIPMVQITWEISFGHLDSEEFEYLWGERGKEAYNPFLVLLRLKCPKVSLQKYHLNYQL